VRPERAYSPAARGSVAPDPSRVLVIGCGALARELVAVIDQAGLSNVDLTCLPATLHNRPGGIPAAVRAKVRAARPWYERIFIAYADCGTGGLLDAMLADEGVERLPGAHCYEFYSGSAAFATMADEEPGTFFLTDFLARNFDRLVWVGLGLDRHPELLPAYFGNYRRLIYLAQTDDPALVRAARRAARRLGLTFELRRTGYGDLAASIVAAAAEVAVTQRSARALSLAPDATNVARDIGPAPTVAESLHAMQPGPDLATRGRRSLHLSQEPVPQESLRRRWLRSMQRDGTDLQPTQDSRDFVPSMGSPSRQTVASTERSSSLGAATSVAPTRHTTESRLARRS
jgi:hypothetical protein